MPHRLREKGGFEMKRKNGKGDFFFPGKNMGTTSSNQSEGARSEATRARTINWVSSNHAGTNSPGLQSPVTDGSINAGEIMGLNVEKIHLGVLRVVKELEKRDHVSGSAVLVLKRPRWNANVPLSNRAREVCFASAGTFLSKDFTTQEWAQDSAFSCSSVAKVVVSLAALLLVEGGQLALRDCVQTFLGEEWAKIEDITILQLMTHTAGLPKTLPAFDGDQESILAAVQKIPNCVAESEANDTHRDKVKFELSCATDVLACIIERISGLSWRDFIETQVFSPLGMRSTKFGGKPASDTSDMQSTMSDLGRLTCCMLNGGRTADGARQQWSQAALKLAMSNSLPRGEWIQTLPGTEIQVEPCGFSPAGLCVPSSLARSSTLASDTCCWWVADNGVCLTVDVNQGIAFIFATQSETIDQELLPFLEKITNSVYGSLLP